MENARDAIAWLREHDVRRCVCSRARRQRATFTVCATRQATGCWRGTLYETNPPTLPASAGASGVVAGLARAVIREKRCHLAARRALDFGFPAATERP